MTERCMAANCGRVYGIEAMFSGFEDAQFCAFHRGKLEAGEGVLCRDGDTAWDTGEAGVVLIPPKWEPREAKDMSNE